MRIEMPEVEVVDFRVVGFLHAITRVGGEPAPGGDVDLAPVVHGPTAGLGFPAALPARGDAGDPAHGDKDRALYATISATAGEAIFGQTRDHAIFLLGVPGNVAADPVEDFARFCKRIRLVADDLFRLLDDRGGEL